MKLNLIILICVLLLFSAGYWAGQRGDQLEEGRTAMVQEIAACTLERARREECWIPCAGDEDCLAKNGMSDH